MRTIRISEEVWQEIAKRGVFGETPDIVLRRVFEIEQTSKEATRPSFEGQNRALTSDRRASFRRRFKNGYYIVSASNGKIFKELLPDKGDKDEIRRLTENVRNFTKINGGTVGQINASSKKLTEAGYHIYGPVY